MARRTLVLDASVGVKWFSAKDEDSLPRALDIRDRHVAGDIHIMVPDLFYYEVINALVHKRHIPSEAIQQVIADLFDLGLGAFPVGNAALASSALIARQFTITVYDACYVALARENACPLVTANPRHQRRDLGCQVVPIEEWQMGLVGGDSPLV